MSPLANLGHGSNHRGAARLTPRLNSVRRVEHAVEMTIRLDANAEVRADLADVVRKRIRGVADRTFENNLVTGSVLRIDPGFGRELAQGVEAGVQQRAGSAHTGNRRGLVAREPKRLTAIRIHRVQRIGECRGRHLLLFGVADAVVVRIIAFVLLEREHEALGICRSPRIHRKVRRIRIAVHVVVLRHVARLVESRRVRHPQRSRIRVRRLRARDVRVQSLLVVVETIAIGIAAGRAHHPRILHRVKDRLRRRHHRPTRPGVVPMRNLLTVGLRDDVERDHAARDLAEERVEAVEQLVVVVHTVTIGIPVTRIRRAVVPGGIAARNRRGTQHHAVAHLVIVDPVLRRRVERNLIPGVRRHRKVAELTEVPGARGRITGGLDLGVERLAVHDVHRDEAEELQRGRAARRHPLAHQRRGAIIVAEVAQRLDQVFLEVLQAIVVEVEVTTSSRCRIDEVRIRVRVAREGCRTRTISERTIHTCGDVRALRHIARLKAIATTNQVERAGINRKDAIRLALSREDHAGILPLPRVGQAVAVRINRARVEAAATDAGGTIVTIVAINEAIGVHPNNLVRTGGLITPHERGFPCASFLSVQEAIAIRILVRRIGREELIVPARDDSRVVRDNRITSRIGSAGIRTRIFLDIGKLVIVSIRIVLLLAVRIVANIEFPTIRHAIHIGIRAVELAGERRFAHSHRHPLRSLKRQVRTGRPLEEDIGKLLVGPTRLIVGDLPGLVAVRRVLESRRGLVTVLQEEIFVQGRIGDRVDSLAGVALVLRTWCRGLPAFGHIAVLVVPARARIKAELRIDLIMD